MDEETDEEEEKDGDVKVYTNPKYRAFVDFRRFS
jgi:hypothetical protein